MFGKIPPEKCDFFDGVLNVLHFQKQAYSINVEIPNNMKNRIYIFYNCWENIAVRIRKCYENNTG